MGRVTGLGAPGGGKGDGNVFAIENHAEPALASLRYKLKDADMQAAEESFDANGKKFTVGTLLIKSVDRAQLDSASKELGLQAVALGSAPNVKTHPVRAARILLVHTSASTQTGRWWQLA